MNLAMVARSSGVSGAPLNEGRPRDIYSDIY